MTISALLHMQKNLLLPQPVIIQITHLNCPKLGFLSMIGFLDAICSRSIS